MYHTLGQRKGLGIGGMKNSNDDPWYVVDKDLDRNVLVVGQGGQHPRLMSVGFLLTNCTGSIAPGLQLGQKLPLKPAIVSAMWHVP